MKWAVALLVVANLGLWFGVEAFQAPRVSGSVASGNLPRVASLKADEGSNSLPTQQQALPDPASEPTEKPLGAAVSSTPSDTPPHAAPGLDPELLAQGQARGESPGRGALQAVAQSSGQGNDEARAGASEGIGMAQSPTPLMCVRLGLLESLEDARRLVERQPMAGDVSMSWQEVETTLPPFHWVIIPPQPRPVALKQFRDIQRQGIDSYLVTEGENRNAISLGLFESRKAAISVLEEKKRQNLNAILANFPRNQISYALVFKAEPDLAKDVVQAVKTDYGTDFDFVEINPC